MTLPSLSPAQTHPTHQEGFSFFGNLFEDCRAISKRLSSSGLIDPSRRISLTSIATPPTNARKPRSARIRRYAKPTNVLNIEHPRQMRIRGDVIGQELEGNEAIELNIFSLIDNTHPTASELLEDAVMGNGLADHGLKS